MSTRTFKVTFRTGSDALAKADSGVLTRKPWWGLGIVTFNLDRDDD